ncbi:hypothetical protein STCU_10322 [Strigomonas culicis]|uniref:Transmembrane protein n=1 Tax=Strigomonas culicis TaxID=28005 RepID=S9TNE2_9TRYP|nr:hypothetical protein STCU_10322 [Strigomonas culicis]|eukprot:EPY17908.1 hypothetical protein STCU_10322 [Strigomonas culicis]
MVNKTRLLRTLVLYACFMLAASGVLFTRSWSRYQRLAHSPAPPQEASRDDEDALSSYVGWSEMLLVLPFLLLYALAVCLLATAPFPAAGTSGVDRYNRRAFGAACVVVVSFLFLIVTLSFSLQHKLEHHMHMGEDQYRRDQAAAAAARGAEGGGDEAQCAADAALPWTQIVLSSFDALFELFTTVLFDRASERDNPWVDPGQGAFHHFASLQRAEVVALHLAGLLFSLYCLLAFDVSEVPPPPERRDNPGLTMDSLKQLGAGTRVTRDTKAELLQGEEMEKKKKKKQ